MKEKRVKITFYVTPENANKLKAFNIMLENNIDFNTMKEVSEFAIRVSKKSNNEFIKAIQNTEQLKQHKEAIETNKPKFGISAEEFLKTINPTGDKLTPVGDVLSPTVAKNAIVEKTTEIDYTEWQKCPEMRNIYEEVDYDMAKGYRPLTKENARFVLEEGKELYLKLRNNIYTPGYDVNKVMTEMYNLWKEKEINA
jgi:hypothetical protein